MIKKAMVMSAGVGSRLDPLTKEVPKPLVSVLNKPVMDILLQKLSDYGIEEIIANTHYMAENIRERYSKNSPVDIAFTELYEETLSGTAGGVKKCEFFFKDTDNFLVLSADGLHDAELDKIIESHIQSGCIATMAISKVEHKEVCKYGVVVTAIDGTVQEFQEKPPIPEAKSDFINTGIYVFSTRIFDFIPANTMYDFAKNAFPKLLESGEKINTYEINTYWSDIGTIDQYIQSNWDGLNQKVNTLNNNIVKTSNSVYTIGQNCQISPSTKLLNNVVVGNNCSIGENVILDNVILWDGVKISDNITIKNSVIASNEVITESLTDKIVKTETNNKILIIR